MAPSTPNILTSWRDGPAKQAIVDFVARVAGEDGSAPVPVEDRVAVFDNDGTLWCEKPMPIQLDFILRRLVDMARADPGLRERQPWKAAVERDDGWLSRLMEEHYAGDDTNVMVLAAGILAAYDGISVEDLEAQADAFLRSAQHPTHYIVSGGGRDLSRTGRRPQLAAGNSNGDVPMLHFTQHPDKPSLRLLVLHDDDEREFAYTTGAEHALEQAAGDGWTVVSVKDDWATVS
jgi:hypothetical protein